MKKIMSSIAELSVNLRDGLESLLEKSNNEPSEKAKLKTALNSISELFQQNNFETAHKAIEICVSKVDALDKIDSSNESTTLLKLCLLLEQFVETEQLGVGLSDQFFSEFYAKLVESDSFSEDKINYSLVKMLRMVYQKQILSLFRGEDESNIKFSLQAVISDLLSELPQIMRNDWEGLNFYISNAEKSENNLCSSSSKRGLALMDHRLAGFLKSKRTYSTLLPELVDLIRSVPDGLKWIDENIQPETTYISAGVYSRFSNTLKDPLIKLHEHLEHYYLENNDFDGLEEDVQFLRKLIPVFKLMGFVRLSQLSQFIVSELQQWTELSNRPADNIFYEIVNAVWALENSISHLWKIKDYEIPTNGSEIGGWATRNSRHVAYSTFSEYFMSLREKVLSSDVDIERLKVDLLRVIYASTYLNVPDSLQADLLKNLERATLTPEVIEEILLALSYSMNRKAQGEIVPASIIENTLASFKTCYDEDGDDFESLDIEQFDVQFDDLDQTNIIAPQNDLHMDEVLNVETEASPSANNIMNDISTEDGNVAVETLSEDHVDILDLLDDATAFTLSDELDKAFQTLSLDFDDEVLTPEINITAESVIDVDKIKTAVREKHLKDNLSKTNVGNDAIEEQDSDKYESLLTMNSEVNDDFEPMHVTDDVESSAPPFISDELDLEMDEMLLEALIDETGELEKIAKDNLATEVYSDENINELLRVVHTLKANVRIIGLDDLLKKINHIETRLMTNKEYSRAFVSEVATGFNEVFSQIKITLFDQILIVTRENNANKNS